MLYDILQKDKALQVWLPCQELHCIKSIVVSVMIVVIIIVGIIVDIITSVTVLVNAGTLAASDSG